MVISQPNMAILSELKITGVKGKAIKVNTGTTYNVTLAGSGSGMASLALSINGLSCQNEITLGFDEASKSYKVSMPKIGKRFKKMALTSDSISAEAKISGKKLSGKRYSKIEHACKVVSKRFAKAKLL